MIELQHFYTKCTTALSHGVEPTPCEKAVVHLL